VPMGWNPEKRLFCKGCAHYEPIGAYVYQLERDPKMRECKHSERCLRVDRIAKQSMQTTMFTKEA
jgi:hypothetical protein